MILKHQPVTGLTQNFTVAGPIFVNRDGNENDIATEEALSEIENRFRAILGTFLVSDKNPTSSLKKDNALLPFTSRSILGGTRAGLIGNHLILHFENTYAKDQLFFVYDLERKTVRNYIDIETASIILDNDAYESMIVELHLKRNIDRFFPGIDQIQGFIEEYEKVKHQYSVENNDQQVAEETYFEIIL